VLSDEQPWPFVQPELVWDEHQQYIKGFARMKDASGIRNRAYALAGELLYRLGNSSQRDSPDG
jgi:hypothetical protein